MKTAVVLIIFNRPDCTERVFAEIAKAKPPRLFVIADGPRENRPNEAESCAAARAITKHVDWDCEVLTNYSDVNLGCKQRVSSGLDWVFEHCEEAIILEDDCLPHQTFFLFCEELLEKYRDDERIMTISGNNFLFGKFEIPHSYYYSKFHHIWGWATWRRAWRYFDAEARAWPEVRKSLPDILGNPVAARFFQETLDKEFYGVRKSSWAYCWSLSCRAQHGLCILPSVNLVSNIGFDKNATHTSEVNKLANLPTYEMPFPLRHPPFMIRHVDADKYSFERVYLFYGEEPTLYHRLHKKFHKFVPKFLRAIIGSAKRFLIGKMTVFHKVTPE